MAPTEIMRTEDSWIQKTPDICGGDPCIRNTRIPVWSIVSARHRGATQDQLLSYFVTPLTPGDIRAAIAYYEQHAEEIDQEIRQNQEA